MKKPIFLSLLCLAMGAAACLGACDDGEDSTPIKESSSSYVDPYVRAEELAKAAIEKVPSIFDQEEFHVTCSWYSVANEWNLEKDANGFYCYEYEDTNDIYSTGVKNRIINGTFSEAAKDVINYSPAYFFEDGGNYYARTIDEKTGAIAKEIYDEIFAVVNVFKTDTYAELFDGDNFNCVEIYNDSIKIIQRDDISVAGMDGVTYTFYVHEPRFTIKAEDMTVYIDYPKNVQEFVNLFTDNVVFENPNTSTDDFGYDVSKLQALHTAVRGNEHKETLPTNYNNMVAKIAAGNYYVKVTTTSKIYNPEALESQHLTQTHEYWNKDGQIKRVNGEEELYFNMDDFQIIKKLKSGAYLGYEDSSEGWDIRRFAKFQTEGFMDNLTRNGPSYDSEKGLFKTTWNADTYIGNGYNDSLYQNTAVYYFPVEMTYDDDSFTISLSFKRYGEELYDTFTYEFSQFGEVDFELPTDTAATLDKILDEINATNTYRIKTKKAGSYDTETSYIVNGQGEVGGYYGDKLIQKDGKYYSVVAYNTAGGYRYYEISKQIYEDLLPASSYAYAEVFDKENYTASGDGYTYTGKNFDATVEIVENEIVLTVTENRIPSIHNELSPITLSANASTIYVDSDFEEDDLTELPVFSLEAFEELTDEEDRHLGYSSYDVNGSQTQYMQIDGNVLLADTDYSTEVHHEFENGNWYSFHYLYGTYHTEYVKAKTDVLSGYNANVQKITEFIPNATMRYLEKNCYLFETADDYMLVAYTVYYDYIQEAPGSNTYVPMPIDNYSFTFSDGTACGYGTSYKEIAPYADDVITHMSKSVEDLKADIEAKNYVYTEGNDVYTVDGSNYMEKTLTGLKYYIKNQTTGAVYEYDKTLNNSGIFTYEEKGQITGKTFSPDEIIALVNSGLTSTCTYKDREPIFAEFWHEFENKAVAGIDGVENCKFTYNEVDNSYTISINDGERTITLTEVGNVTVEKPSEDKMTLFAESMQYNNDFTWTVEGKGSQRYKDAPLQSAVAGATMVQTVTKVQDNKALYTVMTHNPLSGVPALTTEYYAHIDGENTALYKKGTVWEQTIYNTAEDIYACIPGLTDADIAALLDVTKYTDKGNGRYTLNEGCDFEWQWDYDWITKKPITVEIENVVVQITDGTLVITGVCADFNGFTLDMTFTFNAVNSTQVVSPV